MQRLHRADPGRPAFIPWVALHNQFGWHYERIRDFRRVFCQTLDSVCSQYRGARIETDSGGLTLRNSPPPVKGRISLVSKA